MAIAGFVFIAVLIIIVGTYWAFILRPEEQDGRAVRARLRTRDGGMIAASLVKARERLSVVEFLDRFLGRWDGAVSGVTALIARAGLRVTAGAVVLACIFS